MGAGPPDIQPVSSSATPGGLLDSVPITNQVLAAVDCGIAVHDLETGSFLDCNQAALRLFGAERPDQVIGRHPADLSPPRQPDGADSFEAASAHIQRAMQEGSTRFDFLLSRCDGTTYQAEVSLSFVTHDDQKLLVSFWLDVTRRAEAEAALRAREAKYRRLVEGVQTDYIIFGYDVAGGLNYVSPSSRVVLGFTPDEMMGRDWRDFMATTETVTYAEKKHSDMLGGSEFPPIIIEARHADGGTRILEVLGEMVWNDQGEVVGVEGIGKDVTEQTRLQQQLEQQAADLDLRVRERTAELQRRLELERMILDISLRFINLPADAGEECVVDALREIAAFLGVECCDVYLFNEDSSAAEVAYQWSADETPPMTEASRRFELKRQAWALETILDGESVCIKSLGDLPPGDDAWADQLRSRGVRSFIQVPMRADDRVMGYLGCSSFASERDWQEDDLALLKLTGGVLVNFLLREEAERELRLSEERLRLTIETVEDGLFDLDIPTRTLFVSDHTLRTFGLPEGENNRDANRWRERVHPHDRERVERALENHFRGLTPLYEVEYRLRNPEGEYTWRQARGRVVDRDDSGVPRRMLGVDRDITDRVLQNQRMQELESQLAHLGRVSVMGETVAGIAHEVNQPLHAAATFCATARRALVSGREDALEKGVEMTIKVGEQVTRAGDIIRRIRDFTRPQPARLRRLGLNNVVRESVAMTSHLSHNRDVALEIDLAKRLPAVEGDAIQIQQVVVNLLQNAYDVFDAPGLDRPTIHITTRRRGDWVEAVVADNGPECPIENTGKMFETFFTTKTGGMGIGLSLCRTIVDAHRGQIVAEKNPGGGMTFTVRLPAEKGGEL